jgi:ADP-ribose pyrophosphatase YjhB (NUDIX family)
VFARRYADGNEHIDPLDAFSPYDGEVLLVVDSDGTTPSVTQSGTATKPVVAAIPGDVTALEEAAREVAAVTTALEDPIVVEDWVARRELGERLAQTRVALEHAIVATFSADACRWILLGAAGDVDLPAGRGSAALSAAADLAYPSTPTVCNEMLNRTDLTSQGSKARRLLLEAMIERGADRDLGFDGYRPEMAMYRAFLERTGLHGVDTRNDVMVFRKPTDESLQPAWVVLEDEFKRAKSRRINLNDVYAALLLPPIGMKAAVIPVFVTTGLLAFADEIAIYEHGTFKPMLSPDVSERMVRNPGHFDIKHFANTTGARREVVDALATRLDVRPGFRKHRVANVLAIVGHLISEMSHLDNYTLRTGNLTEATLQARQALVSAVEPDELLFVTLPKALGFKLVPSDTETYSRARDYADSVGRVLDELTSSYDRLLTELLDLLLDESAEISRLAVSGQAAALEDEVLDPAVRAFVLTLGNDTVEGDTDWIKAIATVVAKKAPAEWTDDDLQRFRHELPEQLASFQRLLALHAQRRADGGGPFDPLRVTFTRPDGGEHARLIGIDHRQRDRVERALDGAVGELVELMGSVQRAQHALLAVLGERLLPERVLGNDEVNIDLSEERAQNA